MVTIFVVVKVASFVVKYSLSRVHLFLPHKMILWYHRNIRYTLLGSPGLRVCVWVCVGVWVCECVSVSVWVCVCVCACGCGSVWVWGNILSTLYQDIL